MIIQPGREGLKISSTLSFTRLIKTSLLCVCVCVCVCVVVFLRVNPYDECVLCVSEQARVHSALKLRVRGTFWIKLHCFQKLVSLGKK